MIRRDPAAPDHARQPVDRDVLRVAYVAVFTGLLATLDSTIVSVALNSISRDLHASLSTAQWAATGYLLALALSLPISGWLVDRIGIRRTFLIAVVGFATASAACAAAPTIGLLTALRVLQGLAGGLLVPLGQIIVTHAASDDQLGRVMSLVGAPAALGPVLGPVIGGLITSLTSWRWVFLINVPIASVALVLGARRLPHPRTDDEPGRRREPGCQRTAGRLDVVGLLLLSPALALLIYALSTLSGETGSSANTTTRLGATTLGAILVVAFTAWSLNRPATGPRAALVDLRLLRCRPFGPSVLAALATRVVGDGSVLLVALYLQQVRHADPLTTGLLLVPQGLGAIVGLRVGGRLIDQRGARATALAGTALLLMGTIPLLLAPGLPTAALLAALAVRGLGTSLTGLPPVAAAYQGLDRSRAPRATTTLNIAQRLGSPLGTAVLITVLTASTSGGIQHAYAVAFTAAALTTAALVPISLLLPRRSM